LLRREIKVGEDVGVVLELLDGVSVGVRKTEREGTWWWKVDTTGKQ